MSFDKDYLNRKDRRSQPFEARGAGCRNHGACGWCRDNRTYSARKAELKALDLEAEVDEG